MKIKALTVAAACMWCLHPDAAFGKWYAHADSGVEIDVPAGWQASADGTTGLLYVEKTDSALAIVLWVPDDTWEGALASLDTELDTIIEFSSLDSEPEDGLLNSLIAHRRTGTGNVGGDTVQWSLTLVQGVKPVIALAFATPAVWSTHAASADSVVGTLRLLN